MIIKSFIAESAAAALKQVRHTMGGDAVVLKTRQVRDPRGAMQVEVTALLDRPTVAQTESIFDDSRRDTEAVTAKPRQSTPANNAKVIPISASANCVKRILKDADFSDAYADYLVNQVLQPGEELADSLVSLSECLIHETESFYISDLTLELGDKLMVVGPAGSGKTSVLGKLAAHLIFQEKKKVRFLSLDNMKVGAADEIQTYADLLGVDVVDTHGDLIIGDTDSDCVTLIDTPALPTDENELARLIDMAASLRITHTVLCLSCLTRESDLFNQMEKYQKFDPQSVVMTMTDLSWRYGSVLSALKQTSIPLMGLTDNSGGLGRLHLPSGLDLVDAMLKGEVYREPTQG